MTPRTYIAAVLSLLLLPLSAIDLRAQSGKMQFSCISWSKLPYEKVYYADGKKMLPLQVAVGRRSELQSISNAQSLKLFISNENAEGKMEYKQVAEAALIASSKRMLFIVGKARDEATFPISLYGLDDSLASFPPGSFRFLNFTPLPLEVTFNGKSSRVKPKAVTLIKSRVAKGGGFLPFTVKLLDGRELFETRLYSQQRGREMVLIGPPPKGQKNLKIKFLSEVIPVPKTVSN